MWIFISALAVDSVQVCHLFITIKYLHSFSPQESSVCTPRETGEWIFAVRIWAKQEARICKLPVPSAIHTDRLPEEDLFAKCNMEWCSSHMCKRYLFNRLLGPHFWRLYKSEIMHLLGEFVLFLFQTHTHTGQTSRVQCSPPGKLLNGYHKPAAPDTAAGAETIEFFCNKPYILSGNHQSTCFSNGSWSSRPPKCVRGSSFV